MISQDCRSVLPSRQQALRYFDDNPGSTLQKDQYLMHSCCPPDPRVSLQGQVVGMLVDARGRQGYACCQRQGPTGNGLAGDK